MKNKILLIFLVLFTNFPLQAQLSSQIYNANIEASCIMFEPNSIDFSYKIASISGFQPNHEYLILCKAFLFPLENVQIDLSSNFIPIKPNEYKYLGSSNTVEDIFVDFLVPYPLAVINSGFFIKLGISDVTGDNIVYKLSENSYLKIIPASEIASPFVQCNNSGTIVLNELYNDYGSTLHWSVLQNGNSISIGDGLVANYSNIQKGSFEVKYHLDFSCGVPSYDISKSFRAGEPQFIFEGDQTLVTNEYGIANLHYIGGSINSINWTKSGAIASITGTLAVGKYKAAKTEDIGYIFANATNACGSVQKSIRIEVADMFALIYPNPADNEITVEIENEVFTAENTSISIYDQNNTLKYKTKVYQTKNTIQLNSYKSGIYWIELNNGVKSERKQFIVN